MTNFWQLLLKDGPSTVPAFSSTSTNIYEDNRITASKCWPTIRPQTLLGGWAMPHDDFIGNMDARVRMWALEDHAGWVTHTCTIVNFSRNEHQQTTWLKHDNSSPHLSLRLYSSSRLTECKIHVTSVMTRQIMHTKQYNTMKVKGFTAHLYKSTNIPHTRSHRPLQQQFKPIREFSVSSSVLLFSHGAVTSFSQLHFQFLINRLHVSSCDHELWPMTLTYKHDLNRNNVNQQAILFESVQTQILSPNLDHLVVGNKA